MIEGTRREDSPRMFAKSKSQKLRDQAQDLADSLAPHVETARGAAKDAAKDAREQLAPLLADAREKAAPAVAEARKRFSEDVVPTVAAAIADAREQAGPVAEEAKKRGIAAAAALKGEQPKPKGRKRKFLFFAAVLGGAVVAVRKALGAGQDNDSWQSAYTPPPAPPTPQSPPAPSAAPSASTGDGDDAAGASPDEALADQAEDGEAHPVTTPDEPADVVDVDKAPKKK